MKSPSERAKRVAEAIINIGKSEGRKSLRDYREPKLSEREAEDRHYRAQARKLK